MAGHRSITPVHTGGHSARANPPVFQSNRYSAVQYYSTKTVGRYTISTTSGGGPQVRLNFETCKSENLQQKRDGLGIIPNSAITRGQAGHLRLPSHLIGKQNHTHAMQKQSKERHTSPKSENNNAKKGVGRSIIPNLAITRGAGLASLQNRRLLLIICWTHNSSNHIG